jgi:hypothetical protein
MTRPRRAGVGAGVALATTILSVLVVVPARGDPGDEVLLLGQTAAARAQRRLGALSRSAELDAVARRHADRLAATAGPPFHNPNLFAETPGWISVGEVVGRIDGAPGWEVRLQQRFMASPAHRVVILSSAYTEIGVGTARSAGGVVNAVEVLGRSGRSRPPRPPRATRAQPAPAPRALPAAPPTIQPPPPPPPPPTTSTSAPPTTTTTAPLSIEGASRRASNAPVPSRPLRLVALMALSVAATSVAGVSRRRRPPGRRGRPAAR